MKIHNDPRVDKQIRKLPEKESARIINNIELFRDFGFQLSQNYLKKLTNNVWELRPGRYRLLFGIVNDEVNIVNIFMKKTHKTPKNEIELAENRLTQYYEAENT